MSCAIADGDSVQRYVAATLPATELEAFELHLITCSECQQAVRVGAGARAVLRTRRRRVAPFVAGVVTMGAAAAIAFAVLQGTRSSGMAPIAAFTPPSFGGTPVRAAALDSVRGAVDSGTAAYARGDYRAAARLLGAAAVVDSSPGVAFYLGAARLASGDPRAALEALTRARDPEGNPFADDARLVEAKAWLALSNADSALAALRGVSAENAAARARASALADSVQRLRR